MCCVSKISNILNCVTICGNCHDKSTSRVPADELSLRVRRNGMLDLEGSQLAPLLDLVGFNGLLSGVLFLEFRDPDGDLRVKYTYLQIVDLAEGIRILPGAILGLVAFKILNRITGRLVIFSGVGPDHRLNDAHSDFGCWFAFSLCHCVSPFGLVDMVRDQPRNRLRLQVD